MKNRHHAQPALWAAMIVLCGALLGWQAEVRQTQQQQRDAEARFQDLAQRARDQLLGRMQRYEFGLRGMRGALITMGERGINRQRVLDYAASRDTAVEFPGARGYGFIRRVPVAQEADFLKLARRDGKPDFQIRQLTPHTHERLIIQYIEPEAENREAVGLDIASEGNRRLAALKAMETGQATLTHPITLVQASGKVKRGFLLMLPTYPTGQMPATPAERAAQAYGLAYAPLVIDEVLASFDFRQGEFSLTLYDQADDGTLDVFYEPAQPAPAANGLSETNTLSLFGRHWTVEIKALPPFVASLNHPPAGRTGLLVVLASLAVSGLTYGVLLNRARRREVAAEQARRAAIVSGSTDAIIGLTPEGNITDWNPAAEHIFGHPARAVLGQPTQAVLVPQDCTDEEAQLLAQARNGKPVHQDHARRRRADGSLVDVSYTLTTIRDLQGNVTGLALTMRDISESLAQQARIQAMNTELAIKVAERTANLEASNQELAEFAYLAMHDLRTPLRAIDGFGNLLLSGLPNPSPAVSDHLHRIRWAAQRMGQIIDDMHALIQVTRTQVQREPVNLSALAKQAADRALSRHHGHDVALQVQADCWALADPKLLRSLLDELFDNAWKFTRHVPNPTVSFGVANGNVPLPDGFEVGSGYIAFYLQDNGIGFDMTYAQQLFAPFRRLHNAQDYPGSGIGLAVAMRIVRKHGGTLRAQGEPGQGATFYFTLPRLGAPDRINGGNPT